MKTRLAAAIACAALCGAAPARPQVTVVERQSFGGADFGVPDATTDRLRLAVVMLEKTGWTRARAVAALLEASGILGQCGVGLDSVEFLVLAVPDSLMDVSPSAVRELTRAQAVARPAVYFVRDSRRRPAFEAEAIGRSNSGADAGIADTVWITAAVRQPGIAFAHELAHVLMDSGEHSDEEHNLMRDETSPRNKSLSAAQCARLRDTGRANGLLK